MIPLQSLWGDYVPRKAGFLLALSALQTVRALQLCKVSEGLWTLTMIILWPWSYNLSLTEGEVSSRAI